MTKHGTDDESLGCTVRWQAPNTEALRDTINVLAKKRKSARWNQYYFDGRETSVKNPDTILKLHPRALHSLAHFRVCERNPQVWRITLQTHQPYDAASLGPLVEWCSRNGQPGIRSIYVNLYLSEAAENRDSAKMRYGDFHAAIRTHLIDDKLRTAIEVGQFGRGVPLEDLRRFYADIFAALGLADAAQTSWHEGLLFVQGSPPWNVERSSTGANYSNPRQIGFSPFDDFSAAWARVSQAIKVALARPQNFDVAIDLTPPAYEELKDELDALASNWDVMLYGGYAPGIDPYTAAASQSPTGRFPIMTWGPSADDDDLYYQAEIIPTPEGPVLEVRSDCADLKKVLKEVQSASGQKFQAVTHD